MCHLNIILGQNIIEFGFQYLGVCCRRRHGHACRAKKKKVCAHFVHFFQDDQTLMNVGHQTHIILFEIFAIKRVFNDENFRQAQLAHSFIELIWVCIDEECCRTNLFFLSKRALFSNLISSHTLDLIESFRFLLAFR